MSDTEAPKNTTEASNTVNIANLETMKVADIENPASIAKIEADIKTINETARKEISLPEGYMINGFLDKANDIPYMKKEYVSDFAKEIARILKAATPSMSASTFNSAYMRELKKYNKKNIAIEERLTTALSLLTTTFKLVASKKAPAILQDIVQAAVEGVYDEKSFDALYRHFDAIYAFLLHYESGGSL